MCMYDTVTTKQQQLFIRLIFSAIVGRVTSDLLGVKKYEGEGDVLTSFLSHRVVYVFAIYDKSNENDFYNSIHLTNEKIIIISLPTDTFTYPLWIARPVSDFQCTRPVIPFPAVIPTRRKR